MGWEAKKGPEVSKRDKYLKFTLSVENLGMLKWYVDDSHNVHADCHGHGGVVFTLRMGATTSYSKKVKLKTRSSTGYVPKMLWLLHFVQE